jgi:hypothetical protein
MVIGRLGRGREARDENALGERKRRSGWGDAAVLHHSYELRACMARGRRRKEVASAHRLWLGKARREKCGRGKRGAKQHGRVAHEDEGGWPMAGPGHGGHGSGGVALARHAAGGCEIERGKGRVGEADWWTGPRVGSTCQ